MSGPFLAPLSSQYWEYELSPEVVFRNHFFQSLSVGKSVSIFLVLIVYTLQTASGYYAQYLKTARYKHSEPRGLMKRLTDRNHPLFVYYFIIFTK